jgi:hypothetical protein
LAASRCTFLSQTLTFLMSSNAITSFLRSRMIVADDYGDGFKMSSAHGLGFLKVAQ